MWKLLFLSISLVGIFIAAEEQNYQQNSSKAPQAQPPVTTQAAPQAPYQKGGVKDGVASGRYHDGGEHDGHDYGHGQHHQGHRIFRGYDAPLIDDYICDLDATILVVTNSDTSNAYFQSADNVQAAPVQDAPSDNNYGRAKRSPYAPIHNPPYDKYGPRKEYAQGEYHQGRDHYDSHGGYGTGRDHYDPPAHEYGHDQDHHYGYGPGVAANADRLRCSKIAGIDEDSCTTCCRLSARRDRSISKEKIIGFLVDNNQVSYDAQSAAGEGYGGSYSDRKKRSQPDYAQPPTYAQDAPAEVPTPEGDYRCVCCAPKRYRPFIFDRFFRRHQYRRHEGHGGHGPY